MSTAAPTRPPLPGMVLLSYDDLTETWEDDEGEVVYPRQGTPASDRIYDTLSAWHRECCAREQTPAVAA